MYTGILHTHTLLVVLYILFFLIKFILLLTNNQKLATFRRKTKVVEMVLASLFLLTGIYLLVAGAYYDDMWFWVKFVLILIAIGLGVATFKRNNAVLGFLTLAIFVYTFFLSRQKNINLQDEASTYASANDTFNPTSTDYDAVAHGKQLFTDRRCYTCHGESGNLKIAGAADLTISQLPDNEIKEVIKNGRKNMPPYGKYLTEEQVNALSSYIQSIKK